MEFQLDHPYWTMFFKKEDGPTFDRQRPSVENYRRIYESRVEEFYTFANCLMQLINWNAKEIPEREIGVSMQMQQHFLSADAVAVEIQKYKALFDAGVITEEEFVAKKHQILGI